MDEPRSLSRLANRFDERFELSIDGRTQQFLSRTKVMINVASVDPRPRSDFSQIETGQDALASNEVERDIDESLLSLRPAPTHGGFAIVCALSG
jgi:hypothetical protein